MAGVVGGLSNGSKPFFEIGPATFAESCVLERPKGRTRLNAIRKHKCFLCSPFYLKGVSLGYVGRIKT